MEESKYVLQYKLDFINNALVNPPRLTSACGLAMVFNNSTANIAARELYDVCKDNNKVEMEKYRDKIAGKLYVIPATKENDTELLDSYLYVQHYKWLESEKKRLEEIEKQKKLELDVEEIKQKRLRTHLNAVEDAKNNLKEAIEHMEEHIKEDTTGDDVFEFMKRLQTLTKCARSAGCNHTTDIDWYYDRDHRGKIQVTPTLWPIIYEAQALFDRILTDERIKRIIDMHDKFKQMDQDIYKSVYNLDYCNAFQQQYTRLRPLRPAVASSSGSDDDDDSD